MSWGVFGFMSSLVHSVFWDLYCAAPERRETCDHSSEAKAFHDYVSTAYKETVANIAFCSPGEDNKFVLEVRSDVFIYNFFHYVIMYSP